MVLAETRRLLFETASDVPLVGAVAGYDDLFEEALLEGSNLEMDWLWLAVQVTRADQQAYAYLRALEINPRSAAAQRGLVQVLRRAGRSAVIAGTLLGVGR